MLDIVNAIRAELSLGTLQKSAVPILKRIYELAHGNNLEEIVAMLAAGPDGVRNTPDDLLPSNVVDALNALLKHELIPDVAALIKPHATPGCWPWNSCC